MSQVVLQIFGNGTGDADYKLLLDGELKGTTGKIALGNFDDNSFTAQEIQLLATKTAKTVVRAILPSKIEIPAALLDPDDGTKLRTLGAVGSANEKEINGELKKLFDDGQKELVARFKALRSEALRRLRNIEIDWKSGRFLDGSLDVRGHAKIELAGELSSDDPVVSESVIAELRATVEVKVEVTVVNPFEVTRAFGVVCRIEKSLPAKLALELDDLNLSLPPLVLPRLDLRTAVNLRLPNLTAEPMKLGGAFSRLTADLEVTHTWTPSNPELVVVIKDGMLRFAFVKQGTTTNLDTKPAAGDRAELGVKITNGKITIEAKKVMVAVCGDGAIATGELTATGSVALVERALERTIGPLYVRLEKVTLSGVTSKVMIDGAGAGAEVDRSSLRANIRFERILVHPIDDPSAVIAFRGEIEINPSGMRVVELELVEPFPFVLVARGAGLLLRGTQKILQILSQIRPQTDGDLDKIRKLLEILGKIAAAVARAAVFIVKELAEGIAVLADLIARGVVKVAEMLVEVLKRLVELIRDIDVPSLQIDVEIRIALEPVELRQVILTFPTAAVDKPRVINALGFRLDLERGWRPGVLIDLVTNPGVYVFAVSDAASAKLATLSTDLWLKRTDSPTTSVVRDAAAVSGDRDKEKPLLSVTATSLQPNAPVLIVLAGMQRGKGVFLQRAVQETTSTEITIPDPANPTQTLPARISFVKGAFTLAPIEDTRVQLAVDFDTSRVLGLLGMGEPGNDKAPTTGDGFLDRLQKSLSQIVRVKETRSPKLDGRKITAEVVLEIEAAGVKTEAVLKVSVDLETFEVELAGSNVFNLESRRIEERALGLTWVVEQKKDADLKANALVKMFRLAFDGGESAFELNKDEARMEIRFDGLSGDGSGVVFEVETFRIGRGGLDVDAKVVDRAVRLNGLDVPFRFTSGRFKISNSRLEEALVAGTGQLPPQLVGEANCTIALAFELADGEIRLKEGSKVELEKMGEPIVCHSTRFTLTITNLELGFARANGYHFYFLVTGSLRFTPKERELESGLLQHLKDIEISLDHAPLTGDPRVLLQYIRFQKELKPKKTFPLFNLFTFELRGFGFHPASPKFEGRPPAVNISGQIRFADLGDVVQPKIDFHELWIAPPKKGESLPRIKAAGLGIELQLAGSVKMRGAVLAVDPDTRTVEGRQFAPDGYDTYGFLGEGELQIPGFCDIAASMGFLEVERQGHPGERKKAFFLYLQANGLSVEIPTPVWTFYLREAGFGFGYRYTLAGIKEAENARSTAQLVRILDDVSRRQGDLARFTAWAPDAEKDNFTLALRGAFQTYPAPKTYNANSERTDVNPFFFDIVAALRSDFTFLLSARGWVGVNYVTFRENAGNFRERPTFRGYLYISVPRKELLLRGLADSRGFIGQDWPEARDGQVLRDALQSVDWTTTLYIRPGLFHYEMGWPDQLVVRLVERDDMRVTVRGGMIFRAAEDGLLFGYNIGAEAFMRFEGRVGGSVGVAVRAELNARFVARVIAFLAAKFNDSLVYGLVSLDARLTFTVEAWMEVDLGFKSFTIRIGFSFSVQFTAAVELAITPKQVGGRVEARIAVQAFGCTLGVGIGFAFNQNRLDEARARVQRFLSLSITSEEPDAPPVFKAATGDKAIEKSADANAAVNQRPVVPTPKETADGKKPPIFKAKFGRDIQQTDFYLVLRQAVVDPDRNPVAPAEDFVYGLFVPREPVDSERSAFYSAPEFFDGEKRDEARVAHVVHSTKKLERTKIWDPATRKFRDETFAADVKQTARWNAPVAGAPEGTLTLALLFDECFLTDTHWETQTFRKATDWKEPHRRVHKRITAPTGSREERDHQREQGQKARFADATRSPFDEHAHQARATVMTMFLDQFATLATDGPPADTNAHVLDLGLVVFGPASEIAKLAGHRETNEKNDEAADKPGIEKNDESVGKPGTIELFNPRERWFDREDPVLGDDRSAVEEDGIKLGWRLSVGEGIDPEQLLHHYEILRTIEGAELTPQVIRVKPCSTIGGRNGDETSRTFGEVTLHAPDWQFIDTLEEGSGVSPTMRRALLPAFGEAEGLEAAKAWFAAGLRDEVTITYSVTPVDVAGMRGLPRSFTVDIRRPRLPIRPAIGEIRMLETIRDDRSATAGAETSNDPPKNLEVFLALNDRAWEPLRPPGEIEVGDTKFTVRRVYRVIVDPEEIEPAGHYGSDGSTSRLRGPGAFSPPRSADEVAFEVAFEKMVGPDDAAVRDLEPEKAERDKLPLWGLLHKDQVLQGKNDFEVLRKTLWRRQTQGPRVATRFFLETLLVFTNKKTGKEFPYESKRVALPVEHVIRAVPATEKDEVPGQRTATMRPEAFEWAVPLAMPPLGEGLVFADSGFARFRVPKRDARLADLGQGNRALAIRRDPERRLLTTVRFAAVPEWGRGKDLGNKPRSLHGTSIATFDLYELDLDELAPLDVTAEVFRKNTGAWRRSRRVASIEHLSRRDAMLVPSGNEDWQGWHAHYPSVTQRIDGRTKVVERETKPIESPWYSQRETMAHVAERRPRLRLLPLAPESAIAELMREGRPDSVLASLTFAVTSPFAATREAIRKKTGSAPPGLPKLALYDVKVGEAPLNDFKPPTDADGRTELTKQDGKVFTVPELRNLLLCLGWEPFADVNDRRNPYLDEWLRNPAGFEGLTLQLEGRTKYQVKVLKPVNETEYEVVDGEVPVTTGSTTIPLDLQSPFHPLLEEALAELALDNLGTETTPQIYRRYTVMPQPVTPLPAKDIEGFTAGTPPEADPYAWKVLQMLGAAATVRLYDLARDEFVKPNDLASVVDAVFTAVLNRWRDAHGERAAAAIVGQPFVEVFLRPGADRIAGPFGAVIDDELESETATSIRLDDEGLAFAQLSLRPRPVAVWRYVRQMFKWRKQAMDVLQPAGTRLCSVGIQLTGRNANDFAEAARARGGPIAEVIGTAKTVVTIPPPVLSTIPDEVDPETELLLRVAFARSGAGDRPLLELWIEREEVNVQTGETKRTVEVMPFSDTSPLGEADVEMVDEPLMVQPDPFIRFQPLDADRWIETIADQKDSAGDAWNALRDAATFAGFAFPLPVGNTPADAKAAFGPVVNAFLPWSQRFLEHGASRVQPNDGSEEAKERAKHPFLALCAPIKALPWRLAADDEGHLTISFLHADRWSHTRAYAVKPVSRYQEVMTGIQVKVQEDAESLVPPPPSVIEQPMGVAVAVAPRTENVEPPMILSSRVAASHVDTPERRDVIELVVARHAEEALANSNRPLMAHLGLPTSLISFSRAYRTPGWSKRLQNVISTNVADAVELPVRDAQLPVPRPKDTDFEQIRAAHVPEIVGVNPSLWKGADIWRIPVLAPHYKLVALTTERSGIVMSEVTAVVQDNLPRHPMKELGSAYPPKSVALTLKRETDAKKEVRLAFTHAMVSHAQLTPVPAQADLAGAGNDDVSHWPDPDVIYVLSRKLTNTSSQVVTVEEDAEVRLVPKGEAQGALNAKPVIVRARGTRFVALDKIDKCVTATGTPPKFTLATELKLRPQDATSIRLTTTEAGTKDEIRDFNAAADTKFAVIATTHETSVDVQPENAETASDYRDRLKDLLDELSAGIAAIETELGKAVHERYRGILAERARSRWNALEDWLRTKAQAMIDAGKTAAELRSVAMPFDVSAPWKRTIPLPELLTDAQAAALGATFGKWKELKVDDAPAFLIVFDLADDAELAAITAPPVAKLGGRLHALLARRILGSANAFSLKLVDSRNPMTLDKDGKPTGSPGVLEVAVDKLPPWLERVKLGGEQ